MTEIFGIMNKIFDSSSKILELVGPNLWFQIFLGLELRQRKEKALQSGVPFHVDPADHVDEVDVGVLLPDLDVAPRPLRPVVGVLVVGNRNRIVKPVAGLAEQVVPALENESSWHTCTEVLPPFGKDKTRLANIDLLNFSVKKHHF